MMRPGPECKMCSLCEGRTNIVYPDGDPSSPVALVGEAPGAEEDKMGKPFVGRSGKVLMKIMEEEGLKRDMVFITNTVKCRPPENRVPTDAEMRACKPCLISELKDKKLIVTLGRSAAKDMIGKSIVMSNEVNKVRTIDINGQKIDLIPAYHPAASFYDPDVKRSLRDTFVIVKKYLV